MDDDKLLRYSRHILLDEIGIEGQEKLLQSRVLAVGCGGLANAALPYLAAAGVGEIIFADDDIVEGHNLQRQTAFSESDIGRAKTAALADRLHAINSAVKLTPLSRRADEAFLRERLPECRIALDCSDNFPTRHALNRAARAAGVPLVSGAAVRFEGQVAVFDFRQPESPCYACLMPDSDGTDGACALFGVFSALLGMVGSLQAAEALKLLIGIPVPSGSLLCIDAKNSTFHRFTLPKNPQCPVCAFRQPETPPQKQP